MCLVIEEIVFAADGADDVAATDPHAVVQAGRTG